MNRLKRLNRLTVANGGISALILFIILTGCIAEIDRPTDVPDAIATSTATAPTPTAEPPTPTPTLVPAPPDTPTPPPTLDPAVPLFLDILTPSFGAVIRTDVLTVIGSTLPLATVRVNAQVIRADAEGRFEANVTLFPGQNVISIVVLGAEGSQLRDFVMVQHNPPPPPSPPPFFLVLDQPGNLTFVVDQPVLLAGRTSLQARVTVNGVGVPVDDNGSFSTLVALTPGTNIIQVVALNPEGRTLRSSISIIYDP